MDLTDPFGKLDSNRSLDVPEYHSFQDYSISNIFNSWIIKPADKISAIYVVIMTQEI